ncbi:MAG: carbohydrate kinase [Candidatus Sericytochromatia bacterium]|nr:carbohydrate kinase [Candidatus Sericytochromatia bacterium]
MARILTLGEALIDFVSTEPGRPLAEVATFQRAPGGAPANVAVALARQEIPVGFLGRFGGDPFGMYLHDLLTTENIDLSGSCQDLASQTRLAFIELDGKGERHLAAFSKGGCADERITPEDWPETQFEDCKYLYVGSLILRHPSSAAAQRRAIELAKKQGAKIVCDPNLRPAFWDTLSMARRAIDGLLRQVDILKISADELGWLLDCDPQKADPAKLWTKYPLQLLAITRGNGGCTLQRRGGPIVEVPAYAVAAVEPTGAGDAFVAGLLTALWQQEKALTVLEPEDLLPIGRWANAAGALATGAVGAMTALPNRARIDALVSSGAAGT